MPGCAVQVAVVGRVLEELGLFDQALELFAAHERVVDSVLLAWTRPSCRVGHRAFELRVGIDQLFDHRILTDTRRTGDDEDEARLLAHGSADQYVLKSSGREASKLISSPVRG